MPPPHPYFPTLILIQRYVLPLLSPPTQPQLEADKASIDASFSRAFALIDQLTTDTANLKASEIQRTEKLDTTLNSVDTVIEDLKAANTRREAESRIIADQVQGLKDLVPKALEGWKASGDAKLEELGQEMQSLKKLLENRVGRSGGTATPASTGRGYPSQTPANGIEKPKDNLLASTSNNSNNTPTPKSDSTISNSSAPAPAPGVTTPKSDSSTAASSSGFDRSDRRAAIPAWQMAPKSGGASETSKSESGTSKAEAGA